MSENVCIEGNITFEEALAGLEKSAEALRKPGTALEDAMKSFENGLAYYKKCQSILNDAKQKIEIYKR